MTRTVFLRIARAAFAIAALAASTDAGQPLTLAAPPILAPGQNFSVLLEGCPGDVPIYLGSATLGPTVFPKVGILDIGPPAFIAVLPPFPGSGKISLPCDVPCVFVPMPISYHFQAFAVAATPSGFAVTGLSNAITITLDPALSKDCNHNNIPDICEIEDGLTPDCNHNGIPDECDIENGSVDDRNDNGVPDTCETVTCPDNGVFSALSPWFGNLAGALYLGDNSIAHDWYLEPGALLIEAADGTAKLLGTLRAMQDAGCRLDLDLDLSSLVKPGDVNYPPANSPVLLLLPAAYASNGGPIDPATWRYYKTLHGTLSGIGKLAGAELDLTVNKSAFQLGAGAGGLNADEGGAGSFKFTTKHQPNANAWKYHFDFFGNGDFRLDLRDCEDTCPTTYHVDSYSPATTSLHSLNLPDVVASLGVSRDFHFAADALFSAFSDGTAVLEGTIVNQDDANLCFAVHIDFTGLVEYGNASFPPAGSPKKELKSTAYIENGGPVDPTTWHYYTAFSGTLTGQKKLAGAELTLIKKGPAFQIGNGASGKNAGYGASAWIAYTILHQPTDAALQLGADADGPNDINIDLHSCPED